MNITFMNKPVTLEGKSIQVGDKLGNFSLRKNDLSDINVDSLTGNTVFVVVPSIDTAVCDLEIKRFSKELAPLKNIKAYGVSMDLPFAQARWCGATPENTLELVSDYVDHSFGKATGTYINGIGLLTRMIFVVNEAKEVIYVQYCAEITDQPDYEDVIEFLKTLEA